MPEQEDLQRRVEQLEAQVDELRRHVRRLEGGHAEPAPSEPSEQSEAGGGPSTVQQGAASFDLTLSSEDWLNKIGVGLLLFGIAFLFKYSIEAGWLVPVVRVWIGGVMGGGMALLGNYIRGRRKRLGQILLGGSSATLYATVFAAYQLYHLVAYPVAFAGMVGVTVFTFVLSVRQDAAALSVVGALGGLGTPFLLFTEAGTLPGLVGYTCLILAGAAAIYLWRGWRSLLYTTVIGGWLTFAFTYLHLPSGTPEVSWPRVALQLGILFAWIVFWGVPVAREILHSRRPERWPRPVRQAASTGLLGAFLFKPPAHTLAFSSPLLALAFSRNMWALGPSFWGGTALVGAVVYGLAYAGMRRPELTTLAQAHGLVAAVLMAYGLSELFGGDTLLMALAAEALALHYLAHRLDDRSLMLTGHALFGVVAVAFADRVLFEASRRFLLHPEAVTELITLLLALGAVRELRSSISRQTYRLAVHVLFLGWLWHELAPLNNGQAYVSIAWGSYAMVLLVLGVRRGAVRLRNTALATIFLVVGKLFLVDLSELEALWRILLFLGLGSAFLALSYYLPSVLHTRPDEKAPQEGSPGHHRAT